MVLGIGRGVTTSDHDPEHTHDTQPVHYDTDIIEIDGVRYTLATIQVRQVFI